MLISWMMLAIGQLTAVSPPLLDATDAASLPTPFPASITPGEPSTFVEALIGVAMIAAYLLFARRIRIPRRGAKKITTPARPGSGRRAA